MSSLLGVHEHLLEQGALHALAGFLAYECQAAEVAKAKAEGLRRHYDLGDDWRLVLVSSRRGRRSPCRMGARSPGWFDQRTGGV